MHQIASKLLGKRLVGERAVRQNDQYWFLRQTFVENTCEIMWDHVRYDEMADYMKAVGDDGNELSVEERNLLSVAYKNTVGSRRAAWRIISSVEQKEKSKGNETQAGYAKDYRIKVENELQKICDTILQLLDKGLIPKATFDLIWIWFEYDVMYEQISDQSDQSDQYDQSGFGFCLWCGMLILLQIICLCFRRTCSDLHTYTGERCYSMLLHATAECSVLFLFLTVRPRRQSRKSFTKKWRHEWALTALTELCTGCTECFWHVCWTCFGDAWDMFWTCIN